MSAIRTPAGLRWSCHGCGSCCTGHELGPVEPEVVAGLEAAGNERLWEPAAPGWRDRRPDGDYLRQVDGRCVFLRPDRLCAVHALLGAAAKPGFCREFPYHLVEDDRGTAAIVRATCAGFWRSFRDGEAIGPGAVAEVGSLARVAPRARFAPERVEIVPGAGVATGVWLDAEDPLLAELASRDDEPEALVAAVRGALGVTGVARPEQYAAALAALRHALAHVMRGALASPGGAPHQVAFAEASLARLEATGAPPAALDAEARAWANLLLRSALLGKTWAAWGSVGAGLGVWLLGFALARAAGGRDPESLAPGLAWWERFSAIPLVGMWLNKARPATLDLFLHAGVTPEAR